ncbi:MAG TPA: kelch repeat-containing protein [Flavobacteriales bacterium]|nr:kelch repeat-containing protein [Flavobacteriales bacterium]
MRLLAVALLFAGHPTFPQAWTQLPDFPGTARDDATAFAVGNAVYVGTGRDVDFALRNDWYAFNTVTGEWNAIAAMPTTGRQYCAAFADGQYGYVFGGVDANGLLNELWRYDPMTDAWEQRTSLPGPGRSASVAFDSGLICTGMLAGGIPTDEVWHYDAAADSWSEKAPVPGGPRHRACGSGANELIFGGANAAFEALSDAYGSSPPWDAWYPILEMPGPRYGADGCRNFVVGGASAADEYHDGTWMFHGPWGWTISEPFPGGPRRGGVMTANANVTGLDVRLYYGTGVDLSERKNDWWSFDYYFGAVEEHVSPSVKGYPNPTNGLIRFDLSDNGRKVPYEVFDITGRSIQQGMLHTSTPMDVSQQEPGRYIVVFRAYGVVYHSHFTLIP